MSTASTLDRAAILRWQRGSLACGCLTLAVCVVGAFLGSPAQIFRAYFAAYVFYLGIALGCMAILMIYHLTGGAWGFLIRRVLEAQMNTLPLLAILFIPVAFGVGSLYVWAQPDAVAADAKLQEQQFYLNKTFFLWRAAAYFVIWLALAYGLSAKSRRQDQTGDPRLRWKLQRLSEIGLVLFGTTLHFAAFDWIETLQPTFHSTIFPLLVASGQLLSGHAFVLIAFVCLALRSEAADVVSLRALNDLGNILLSFLIIWAYLVWFQFMLIWIANLPADVQWYLPRSQGGWQWVAWFLFIAHFAIPLFLLLLRPVKCNPRILAWVAGLILFMQLVFTYYQIIPAFAAPNLREHWMDFLMPIGVGGIWLSYFLNRLQRRPLLAVHDPNREKALHLRRLDEEDVAREQAFAHG